MYLVCKHDFVLIPYMLKNVISRLVAKLPFIFFPKYLISINRSNFAKTIQKTMLSKSLETQLKARIRAFLQICIPGISAHTLLLISIQRYKLVCKPFGPKMTHFWKRVLFGIFCFISFAYSVPLLTTAGVFTDKVKYMNHNVTSEMCKFSGERSLLISIYCMLLLLIMIANLVTAGLYIPVLRRAKFSFRSRKVKYEINGDGNVDSKTETSQATRTSDVTTQYKIKSKAIIELKTGEIKGDEPNHQRKV